ncbi:hypothetical protein [Phytopseudomonas dryadis]|uniref:Uncharacterized protein n=1 Tax=Phytopseudomonas dryadis TaxID=2487520 RepID=A0A4Q9QT37_9GAMM|nr:MULTISPECIES: hypothetical protein [Pseudomonas]TBU85621.1 hypothetical protein DNK44_24165 [Pseudomonas dryadis]TBU99493.1 hypothetical protein DNK34_24555 [Pseudomonas dryadis]TBV12525.1 hypothetical protein DNK41_24500 [Pseudomonas sp. FRB 230]
MKTASNHDEILTALGDWHAQHAPRRWRLVHYCGVECLAAHDLDGAELQQRASERLAEGFHIAWKRRGEDAVLRVHEGEPTPTWAAVFAERDLIGGLASALPEEDAAQDARRLVACWQREKVAQVLSLLRPDSGRAATAKLQALELSSEQTGLLLELLDQVLGDTLYTLLLGLDGGAAVGGEQQRMRLLNEAGTEISPCGELEAEAYAQLIEERP